MDQNYRKSIEISQTLIALTRRLIAIAVRLVHGKVRAGLLYEILEEQLTTYSAKEQMQRGERPTLSSVALETGLATAVVKKYLVKKSGKPICDIVKVRDTEPNLSALGAILNAWARKYTVEGKPRNLCIYGNGDTFQRLVSSAAGKGISTPLALSQLTASGNIKIHNDHWVSLKTPYLVAVGEQTDTDKLEFGAFSLDMLGETIHHNIENEEPARFQRMVYTVGISAEQAEELQKKLTVTLQNALNECRTHIREAENSAAASKETIQCGVGLFVWEKKRED